MKTDRWIFAAVMTLSILVFALVVILNERILGEPENVPNFVYQLPALNALINACCSVLLVISYFSIRRKRVWIHKRLNLTAFVLSAIFLLSYVTYHYFVGHTAFGGSGAIAMIYKTVLFSHIVLAALVLPLILLSFWYGLGNKIHRHRKLVRFSFPIWLYVTVTGVLIYLMISPYYNFP